MSGGATLLSRALPPTAGRAGSPAATAAATARVLVCDDSAVIRAALCRMLEAEPGIEVVARAANGEQAVSLVQRHKPDVVVLDIEMPIMDGLTALPLLLAQEPRPRIIVASTLTARGASTALHCLRLGASDCIHKPNVAEMRDDSFRQELLAKVVGLSRLRRGAAASASQGGAPVPAGLAVGGPGSAQQASPDLTLRARGARPALLAVGSSTGGPQALSALVQGIAKELPQPAAGAAKLGVPVVITQHMPPVFTPLLAEHLGRHSGLPCAEAADGQMLLPGHLYVAPGNKHLIVHGSPGIASGLMAKLSDAPPENSCRPSVDPMLRSAAAATGGRTLVIMLTGMGQDGLAGTRAVVDAGGTAIAQDEASSVVWGMPGAVARAGLCHQVLPLPRLATAALHLLELRR